MTAPSAPPEPADADTRVSGVVVTYNDARHLDECLSALSFCDELVVVDLGSHDGSVTIAETRGARIVHHPWVAVVEQVRRFAVDQARFEWIAFMDPDMIFPTRLVPRVRETIAHSRQTRIIGVPYRNYFLGQPVRHGRWGGSPVYPAVFHRDAFDLQSDVHRGFAARDGATWTVLSVPRDEEIVHHWVEKRSDMDARARRYATLEGEARYGQGERFSWARLFFEVPRSFASSLIRDSGYRDGLHGVLLSFYAARLTGTFLLALRRVENHSGMPSSPAGGTS